MKTIYDPETDTLEIILRDSPIAESDEEKPGLILDYDIQGEIVSIEVLDASKKLGQPIGMSFELATTPSR